MSASTTTTVEFPLSRTVEEVADPAAAATDIAALRHEIDRLDAQIIATVRERTAISRRIGSLRAACGGPRIVHSREMAVLDRFREFGREGHDLGMALLRLGRGRLDDKGSAVVDHTTRRAG